MRFVSGWLCLAVLFMGSCKPLHDREGLDPVSEPEYALSEGGRGSRSWRNSGS